MLNRDAYLSAFERFSSDLPADERQQRFDVLNRFFDIGLPGTDIEEWKYTDFARLAGEPVTLPDCDVDPDTGAYRLANAENHVWINGRATSTQRPVSAAGHPSPAHAGFAALNQAFARSGLVLELAAGERRVAPVQAVFLSQANDAGTMVHLHHVIRLGAGASASVILQDIGLGDNTRWLTQTLDIELAEDAQLQLIRVQDESSGSRSWFQATATLQSRARLDAVQIDFGGGVVRNDWRIRLAAPEAHAELHGLYAPTGRTHVDNHTLIDHLAPRCTSREFFRGLAWERAKAVFNGKIVVHPDAQKTDSEQRLANLILSPKAEINAKPELEIFADDVKCAHGATFGRLDPTALFYLRSRGIPEDTSRALLTYSFANEIFQHIRWPELRNAVTERFLERLGSGLDVQALA